MISSAGIRDAGTKTLAEIPKIAQRRLQNEQLGGEVAHPDADLLTAFAEQALPARERDQVLAHLARCTDCREVASLAGAAVPEPELVAAPKQVDHKPGRSFWSLRPLRWTAAAATAAVVLSAVWLNRKEVTRRELPAGTETNPAIVQQQNEPMPVPGVPATDKESAPQASALRSDNAPKFDALTKSKAASPKERDELAGAAVNEVRCRQIPDGEETVAHWQRHRSEGHASAPRAGGRSATSRQSAIQPGSGKSSVGCFCWSSGEDGEASPSAHPVSSNDVALAPAKSAPQAPAPITMTYSRQAAAELAPADQVAESQTNGNASGATRDSASQVRVGPMATPLPNDPASLQTLQKSLDLKSAGTLWRVSSSGELQQSTDSGQNWRTALGEHPSKFKAVASAGATVWAGGDDGALWSSLNNGLTWRKLAPTVDGHSPRGTVEKIQLAAPKNVTFRTSAGETWSSPDGGINWTVKSE